MGIFSVIKEKFANHKQNKRMQNASVKTTSTRREYLLDDKTPFDVTEAFRSLKASLSVSVPKKKGGVVIMANSAYPKEGKTTIIVNLALMFAQSDVKVILVDADIRKGRVARYFHQKTAPGVCDYLSGQNTLEEVIHDSHLNPNLSYITCGTRSPKPYELLESAEMKAFIKELRSKYDYVLIDTPPILLVSDALTLSSEVDGAFLVCRHRESYVSDISRTLKALQFAKVNVLGVVVNDYKATAVVGGNSKEYSYYNYVYKVYKANEDEDAEADEALADE